MSVRECPPRSNAPSESSQRQDVEMPLDSDRCAYCGSVIEEGDWEYIAYRRDDGEIGELHVLCSIACKNSLEAEWSETE